MSAVAETSREAYHAIQRDGTLTRQQAQVMQQVQPGRDYSLQELVKLTGLPVNVISGRCNELRTAKRLEHGPERKCSVTGRTIHPVRLPTQPQGQLFDKATEAA
jgi:hypothetical protein